MKLLADDIYGKISAIVPNTYFSQLPANIDSSQNFCVYELEVDESKNTLHERDFEQGVEIIVKVLSKDIGYLFDTVESIRQAVLQHTANYYSPIVKNTIPVFYDENLKLHQYSIVFGVNRGSIPFTGTLVNKYAPDATAVVQDQDGNVLATENIPSGGSKEIIVNGVAEEILYTYNYSALNTGQDVSYATGDDKWVRDNLFNPEVATWDTNLKWVFPVLDTNDPTKLSFGVNPDGSGNNIFGNKERFTDTLGGQVYDNGLVIDHYLGEYLFINEVKLNWIDSLGLINGFHTGNIKEYLLLLDEGFDNFLAYSPFNLPKGDYFFRDELNFWSSTTVKRDTPVKYSISRGFNNRSSNGGESSGVSIFGKLAPDVRYQIKFKKAFQYNPTTQQMQLT